MRIQRLRDWNPTQRILDWARVKHPLIDVCEELALFRDEWCANGDSSTNANWDKKFKEHIREASMRAYRKGKAA